MTQNRTFAGWLILDNWYLPHPTQELDMFLPVHELTGTVVASSGGNYNGLYSSQAIGKRITLGIHPDTSFPSYDTLEELYAVHLKDIL